MALVQFNGIFWKNRWELFREHSRLPGIRHTVIIIMILQGFPLN